MDITIIFKIAGIGLLTAVACMLLKKANKEEIATLVSLAGLILALVLVLDMIVQLFDVVKGLFEL
ncbi:MAG TPA: stage III sporulation protein AC [Candidatus Limihabitans stercoravium]|nr:stage III sporulation protein AC [Candidatus Limihabitans stercoravium]